MVIEGNDMDWLQFLELICIPAFGWTMYKIGELRKELNEFEVQVAKEYARIETIQRLENKLDDIRELVISIATERSKK